MVQGTKACLGWEREPQGGTYACTAVTDAWLALLQTAFAAARSVPKQAGTPAASRRATAEADARVGMAVVSYSAALQELLAQLLQHWKALSPAVQPRALWVVAHHLEVASSMNTACMNLLRTLADALAANEDLINSRRRTPPLPHPTLCCSAGTMDLHSKSSHKISYCEHNVQI
ncbi:hypothetical protein COCOBI_06-5580 [Coccomyxa sp. Obi]|nr:hypothetical protein COCOBI_06-5580 [Coccomyxa sp. Obi]